jgi:hypothetical protein
MAKGGQLAEMFQRYARGRGVQIAHKLAVEMRRVLSVQAPTRVLPSGRIVARTKAKPFAPPRRVTGKLQSSVKEVRVKNGVSVRVYAVYGYPLEKSTRWRGWPHKFVSVALRNIGIRGRNS